MDAQAIRRIEASFQEVASAADEFSRSFYERLFESRPELRDLFPEDLAVQRSKLIAALAFVVDHLREPRTLTLSLSDLGHRHVAYGAQPEHYSVVIDIMLDVMPRFAQRSWGDEVKEDWRVVLEAVSEMMTRDVHV